MNRVMSIHWKRSAVTTLTFAIAGLVVAWLTIGSFPLVNWPGYCCLSLYLRIMQKHIWEELQYLLIANAAVYGVVGYFIGAFTKTNRQTLYFTGLFSVIVLFGAFSWFFFREHERYIRHSRLTNELKQSATGKLEVDPNDIYALHWMGVHHLTRTGQYREAEKYFRKVVDLESAKGGFSTEGQRSLIYLAIIYQSWGESERAEEHYRKFIGTNPDLENDLVLLNYNRDYLKRKG
jgi:tetratricopeptide (TPR) repeat protein